MNVAFFLTPKSEVAWVPLDATMRQAVERMEHHRYTAVPLLDDHGRYVGTLTEGDLLWMMKRTPGLTFEGTEYVRLSEVPRRMQNQPVAIDAHVEQLLSLAADQNFVPVVDSREVFIGIVRRKAIIEHCAGLLAKRAAPPPAGR